MDQQLLQAADVIAANRLARARLAALAPSIRPPDEAAAYAIQDRLHELLTQQGLGTLKGHKIGCTTKVMQEFLGIGNPCAGGVFAATVHRSPARVRYADFVRPGVECEIVVQLGADLPHVSAPFDRARVAAAVSAVMAGMEIVDDRYENYKALDTPTLIADDFFDAGCVLSAPLTDWQRLDLAAVTGVTCINGVEVGRGRGSDVLGHPFEALVWLANQLAARGRSLQAGEFVFTGSVVATQWLQAGDRVQMTIEGLGQVEALFA